MKTLVMSCCMLLVCGLVSAQDKSIREFCNNFQGKAEETSIEVGSAMMKLGGLIVRFADKGDEDIRMTARVMKHVRKLKIYHYEKLDSIALQRNDLSALKRNLMDKDRFDMLMEMRENNNQIQLLNRGKSDELGDLVMLVQGDREITVISLHTTLKMDDVNNLVKQFASR
ncbi:uncharacterized protein DUF4252 [Chitinophaga dinghuensis]|uniref:Uncharacterized protein DUF4252 n=1 Tax=Chitinophaga dinghuensis TaxID=1539050 RepID=A0A327VTL6_9BACT|nr:DUF4252 domain-containing protein [Chitinophaga dinghuensis]RAJ79229.1 uncharacterized protein DUF4252 [Chitinophaga dinghuensis]